jgi:hypothetical protein
VQQNTGFFTDQTSLTWNRLQSTWSDCQTTSKSRTSPTGQIEPENKKICPALPNLPYALAIRQRSSYIRLTLLMSVDTASTEKPSPSNQGA